LIDGDLSPYRVEPDRDPAKRMEWHLLMDQHERRTGYTWLELGRRDDDGIEQYVTIGCGMEARKGGGAPNRWFLVTPDRMGEGFKLVENRVPLSKSQLNANFLAFERGQVFEKSSDYREAVDQARVETLRANIGATVKEVSEKLARSSSTALTRV